MEISPRTAFLRLQKTFFEKTARSNFLQRAFFYPNSKVYHYKITAACGKRAAVFFLGRNI